MPKITIKLKDAEGKSKVEEDWMGTTFYCLFCGSHTVVLRCQSEECACLNCNQFFTLGETRGGELLTDTDNERLTILKNRYQYLMEL